MFLQIIITTRDIETAQQASFSTYWCRVVSISTAATASASGIMEKIALNCSFKRVTEAIVIVIDPSSGRVLSKGRGKGTLSNGRNGRF